MILDTNQVKELIPHRYPFLLVDRVLELDIETGHILALKNVTINEALFQGHFPEVPIFPGVLILEALAQTGGILVKKKVETKKIAVLTNVKEAKFRKPVKPGDTLMLECKALVATEKGGKFEAKAIVDGRVAVQCIITFAFVSPNEV